MNSTPSPSTRQSAAPHPARLLYTLALYLATPLVVLYLLYRSLKAPAYRRHWNERFGFYRGPARNGRAPLVWIHAVSVGETQAAAPLVQALRRERPDLEILMTHMTPTGRATSARLFEGEMATCYLPYDFPGAVARFYRHYQPTVGLLMETEVWPNLVAAGKAQGVPFALVNARLSAKSLARGQRYLRLSREALSGIPVWAQTASDAARFEELGAGSIEVFGNLKFDVEIGPAAHAAGERFRRWIGGRPVLLAASTRAGEELLILDALRHAALPLYTLLVLVPRHPERFAEVTDLARSKGFAAMRRTQSEQGIPPEVQVWVGDSMGEMLGYCLAADVVFVGGGLLPFGTHNLIEPCAAGRPVLVGPHTFNFAEAAEAAIKAGAALRVRDADALFAAAAPLLADPTLRLAMGEKARAFAAQHRGATGRTVAAVQTLLPRPDGS